MITEKQSKRRKTTNGKNKIVTERVLFIKSSHVGVFVQDKTPEYWELRAEDSELIEQ